MPDAEVLAEFVWYRSCEVCYWSLRACVSGASGLSIDVPTCGALLAITLQHGRTVSQDLPGLGSTSSLSLSLSFAKNIRRSRPFVPLSACAVVNRLHKLADKVPRVEYLRLDLPLLLIVLSLMAFNLAVFLSAEHSVSMLINTHG